MQEPLLQTLLSDLKTVQNPSKTSHIVHTVPIRVLLLEKNEVFYISDGALIMQAVISMSNPAFKREDEVRPFNKMRTNFYNFSTRHANLFMFNQKDNTEDVQHPSVYHPKFHFQERIQSFNRELTMCEFTNCTEVLLVRQWGIKVENIANTGYYGVVLDIQRYERFRERFTLSKSLHSILYEKELAIVLENLRIRDMREEIGEPQRKNPISLCYYRKNIKTNHVNKSLQSNFVVADRTGKLIKTNLELRQYYLPLGNVTGVLRFIRPLANYSEIKKTIINFNLFREIPEKKTNADADENYEERVWTDSSSEEENSQILVDEEAREEEEESSDEQEEPLKLIYMRQLQKMNII